MNTLTLKKLALLYKKYLPFGVAILLTIWLVALVVAVVTPEAFRADILGVVAERTDSKSSATVSLPVVVALLVVLPLLLAGVDLLRSSNK